MHIGHRAASDCVPTKCDEQISLCCFSVDVVLAQPLAGAADRCQSSTTRHYEAVTNVLLLAPFLIEDFADQCA
jgi:hypothetical protein